MGERDFASIAMTPKRTKTAADIENSILRLLSSLLTTKQIIPYPPPELRLIISGT